MHNRYATEVGAKGYNQIVSTNPANGPLRIVVAREISWAMNKRPATVVDLGCGGGQSITPVISQCKGVRAKYILVDADQEMLDQAKINVPESANTQLIC